MTSNQSGPLVFAQISDPHLTSLAGVAASQLINKRLLGYISWRRKRRQEHRQEVLQALHKDLDKSPAQHVLVSGDLTHIGLPDEFIQARQWLESLGSPADISVIPGNHDCYVKADWQQTFAQWLPFMRSDQDLAPTSMADCFPSLRVRQGVAFIGVSSAVPKPPLFASGTVGNTQLHKLGKILKSCADQNLFRVVYLHHPPLPGVEKWRKRLTDAKKFCEVIEQHGAELVLYGHCHKFQQGSIKAGDGDTPVIGLPSASAQGDHGEAAGYNLYFVDPAAPAGEKLRIESRRYHPASGQFRELNPQ